MRVRSSDGHLSGMTTRGGGRTVALRRDELPARRRFTLAHELAHHLLEAVARDTVTIPREVEETLCERFAERALMPDCAVAEYLASIGVPADAEALLAFCRHFGVSISAAVRRLDRHIVPAAGVAIFTATCRQRPGRDEPLAYRIDTSATDRRLFLPRHRRLSSCQLDCLLDWADGACAGDSGHGREGHVQLRSRQRGISAFAGASAWGALAVNLPRGASHDGIGLLVFLSTAELLPIRAVRLARGGARSSGGLAHPQQLDISLA
jgi:hypothetical protein